MKYNRLAKKDKIVVFGLKEAGTEIKLGMNDIKDGIVSLGTDINTGLKEVSQGLAVPGQSTAEGMFYLGTAFCVAVIVFSIAYYLK